MNQLSLNECSKRRTEDTYIVVYAIKNEVNVKRNEYITQENIYTFVGIDKNGYRQFLNIYPDKPSNNRYWLDVFEGMKSRGIKNILFLSVDDNKNMKRTAKIAFPNILFVDSITDIVPKFYKYTSDKDEKKLASKINRLYTRKTVTEFKTEFAHFQQEYSNVIHQRLIQKYLGNIESLYKFSSNIRSMLFKHSANIGLYDKIRISFNHYNSYITNIEEVYEKLENANKYFGFTSFKKKEWTLMINDLIQMYNQIDFI